MTLAVRRCGVTIARIGVERVHRHHDPPVSALAAFEVVVDGWPVGWATVGRPVAPRLQVAGWVEVTRVATDGTRNACSMLYGACERWALHRDRGFPIITYTRIDETGASLRGAGWVEIGQTDPVRSAHRNRPGRARAVSRNDGIAKRRWIPGTLYRPVVAALAACCVVRP